MFTIILIITLIIIISFIIYKLRFENNQKVAYVVVLGDVGRSPRMQYHTLSLAKHGYRVYLFGYAGSDPHENILHNSSITIVHISQHPDVFKSLPKPILLLLKFAWLGIALLLKLLIFTRPSHLLIQNPPSIPSMMVAVVVGVVRGACVVVDWHNYGHTIMALSVSPTSLVVRVYKWFEVTIGRLADFNMCVTAAMSEDLLQKYHIKASTLHDRPGSTFRPLNIHQKHQVFTDFPSLFNPEGDTPITSFDEKGNLEFNAKRPALLISSTSWTPDEDFGVLFKALDGYNTSALEVHSNLPEIVCIVTGKGPLKTHYEEMIANKKWSKVRVQTAWLPAGAYPSVVGACDLGVSLHWSSSGLDLPMKVVDMFGCGLPVCSVKYPSIGELVEDGVNGVLFENFFHLQKHLKELLAGFPADGGKLQRMRREVEGRREGWGWDENWEKQVGWMLE